MDNFSIADLQQFSGVKAHTIRMWEQRYGALKPKRSEGNTRYYDSGQLRRLLNIVSLRDGEHSLAELCAMKDEQLFALLQNKLEAKENADHDENYLISQLIAAGMQYDEPHFEKIFSNCVLRFGMRSTYEKVIYPMLERIGLMWANDTLVPSYEHFVSNLIRQKVFAAIDALPPATSKNSWVLFLPENEFHEIGLLISYYLLRKEGQKVVYLGSNVPAETLKNSIQTIAPTGMLFFIVNNRAESDYKSFVTGLKKIFPKQRIYVAANKTITGEFDTMKSVKTLRSIQDLVSEIQNNFV